jgi:Protein of unknown function (DUF3099)
LEEVLAKAQSITTVSQSPDEERKSRMLKYTIAMTIRVVCIVVAIFVEGWLMWLAFAGAIFLPYFAVVLANAQGPRPGEISRVTQVTKPVDATTNFGPQK